MKCIIVNDDLLARKAIETLINLTDNLELLDAFNNTNEALKYINTNNIDLIFFDVLMHEAKSVEFVKNIPLQTFVIYLSNFHPSQKKNSKFERIYLRNNNTTIKEFQRGIDKAHEYNTTLKLGRPNNFEDYFVI